MNRRMAALRAMAEQDESPEEAAIAREKLRAMAARDEVDVEWADPEAHEAIYRAQRRAMDEETIAAIVRRWEHGTFRGMTVRVGASS